MKPIKSVTITIEYKDGVKLIRPIQDINLDFICWLYLKFINGLGSNWEIVKDYNPRKIKLDKEDKNK